MNAWTHYQKYGSDEGVNPSNAFDADAYLTAKAAAMGGDWTADSIAKAIDDNGMTVLEHYLTFAGTGEGEVPAGATYPVSGGWHLRSLCRHPRNQERGSDQVPRSGQCY